MGATQNGSAGSADLKEKDDGWTTYIKEHIERDLSLQPQIRPAVVKVLLSLLKQSESAGEDFIGVFKILANLVANPYLKPTAGQKRIWLFETLKAAQAFSELNVEQREAIKEYLEEMIDNPAQTLKSYLAEKFGLEAKENFDPDSQSTPEGKMAVTMLGALNAANLEDFCFDVPLDQQKSDATIVAMITSYYSELKYEVENHQSFLTANKEDQKLLIYFTKFDDRVMVSVGHIP